ncbi:hypothetical protein CLV43_12079 [Umezawaea tangerina]|uniref:Uncharacterized protein n=2 Tax=Umezawaea tangerina TaxID=84725 RepID=A0A2T0SGW9_9PSEU|nr:hypothetical protein CLV43_12079 [Umezawaea tangerina]
MAGNALLGAAATAGGAIGAAVGSLFAAEGALGKMLGSGAPTQGFEIDRESVLQAGQIIQGEIAKLGNKLTEATGSLQVNAEDEVNSAIAKAWNSRLVQGEESYAGRVRQYIASLRNLVEQLRTAAEHYGFTDEEVVAALGPKH